MVARQKETEQLDEFLHKLADFHERQRQFVQRVQRYRQWLANYRASMQRYEVRRQAQQERGIIPAHLPITAPAPQQADQSTPSDVTDAQWERVASLLNLPQ